MLSKLLMWYLLKAKEAHIKIAFRHDLRHRVENLHFEKDKMTMYIINIVAM